MGENTKIGGQIMYHYDKCPICKKKSWLSEVPSNHLKIKKCCNFCALRVQKQNKYSGYKNICVIKSRDWGK